ncbi:efflux transporter outer membrane subunit [Desulfoferrobacter suflitae]|uniref:efflux transporter outer membrane subunit n=1 Tax=Desulfoferrobacter suflitae TaxID=2865782 RepID=UPI00216497FD|nr:efflux transporter outer membrane subunit [Desulfoferrobacter suflitae]MCK8601540.1 efflux transporter outer membrane subunit [Desulfoferrobacter suflitae]
MRDAHTPTWNEKLGWIFVLLALAVSACTKLGPDFRTPGTDVAAQWIEADDSRVSSDQPNYKDWWSVFADPVLNRLVQRAYQENLPLRIAGIRVLQARAQLGIAVGQFYPQTQQAFGSVTYLRTPTSALGIAPAGDGGSRSLDYWQADIGVALSWELDFWGRFRRAIESADMSFWGSIAAYDAALVSLTADVASTYVFIRTTEERLRIARNNVAIQKESWKIADARFRGGATSERDVQQALTQLNATEATIPQLETSLQQAKNSLSVLLGLAPSKLGDLLDGACSIPQAPVQIAAGIPADLLRRRPDVRNAELQAAAQCAQIGIAKADLYPAFSLSGNIGFSATDLGTSTLADMFSWNNRTGSFGPSFNWNIFNYGRITNNVRLQDAVFQELLVNYQNVVLQAQQEVEDGLVAFLKAQDRVVSLKRAADAAKRSADLATIQYREGATDYTTVLTAQQALLQQQDDLAVTRGDIPQGLIATYRALGGGWEISVGQPFVPSETQNAMSERSNWGGVTGQTHVDDATARQTDTLFSSPDW